MIPFTTPIEVGPPYFEDGLAPVIRVMKISKILDYFPYSTPSALRIKACVWVNSFDWWVWWPLQKLLVCLIDLFLWGLMMRLKRDTFFVLALIISLDGFNLLLPFLEDALWIALIMSLLVLTKHLKLHLFDAFFQQPKITGCTLEHCFQLIGVVALKFGKGTAQFTTAVLNQLFPLKGCYDSNEMLINDMSTKVILLRMYLISWFFSR